MGAKNGSFFHFIDDEELSERAYAYLFSLCDRAEYLFDCPHGKADFSTEAIGTDCEGMIGALEGERRGESWGMRGKILSFRLTDEVKEVIRHPARQHGMPAVWDRRLENLTLYKGEKRLYSVCSHEGYTDIDEDFLQKVGTFCRRELPRTSMWKQLEARYPRLSSRSAKRLWGDLDKLDDLNRQVCDAWQCFIRQPPFYQMTFEEYLAVARDYLSGPIVRKLEEAGGYRELHPEGYARVSREIEAFRGRPGFDLSDLWYDIRRELAYWKVFLELHRRPCPPSDEQRFPSIIINEEKEGNESSDAKP